MTQEQRSGAQETDDLVGVVTASIDAAVANGQYPNREAAEMALRNGLLRGTQINGSSGKKDTSVATRASLVEQVVDFRALIATLVLFAVVIVKVLSVVGFDETYAAALVQAAGPVSVLTGSIVSSLAIVVPIVLVLLVLTLRRYRDNRHLTWKRILQTPLGIALFSAIGVLFLTAVFVSPFLMFSAAVGLICTATLIQWATRQMLEDVNIGWLQTGVQIIGRSLYISLLVVLGVGGLYFMLGGTMWLPPERMRVEADGNFESEVVYVLDDEGEWGSLLVEENRRVIRFLTSQVKSRYICRIRPHERLLYRLYLPPNTTAEIIARQAYMPPQGSSPPRCDD